HSLPVVPGFIGISFGFGYFGISRYASVPLAAIVLIGLPAWGSFRRWERAVYALVALSLAAVPLAILAHHAGPAAAGAGPTRAAAVTPVLLIIALVGTSVAPWQL